MTNQTVLPPCVLPPCYILLAFIYTIIGCILKLYPLQIGSST